MTMTKLEFFTRKVKQKCEKIMEKEMVVIKVSQVAMLSGRMINILTWDYRFELNIIYEL